jgi:exoribonuclease R
MIEAYMILCNMCASKNCPIKRANTLNTITEYTLELKKHENIGIYYTHFTSPIRRYIDIIVHRLIFNPKIYDTKQICNIINKINENDKIYKKTYNIYNLLNIIGDNYETLTNGKIIHIDNNNIKILINNKILNLFIDNRLINNEIIDVYYNDTFIKIKHKENEKILNINENVILKIYFIKNAFNPFKIILSDNYILI